MKAKRSQGQVMKSRACVSGDLETGLDPQSEVEAYERCKEDAAWSGLHPGRTSPVLRMVIRVVGVPTAVASSHPGAATLMRISLNL